MEQQWQKLITLCSMWSDRALLFIASDTDLLPQYVGDDLVPLQQCNYVWFPNKVEEKKRNRAADYAITNEITLFSQAFCWCMDDRQWVERKLREMNAVIFLFGSLYNKAIHLSYIKCCDIVNWLSNHAYEHSLFIWALWFRCDERRLAKAIFVVGISSFVYVIRFNWLISALLHKRTLQSPSVSIRMHIQQRRRSHDVYSWDH